MKLRYRILDDNSAVLITRQPELVRDELCVEFLGAPLGATAIFESNKTQLYRKLDGTICSVPVSELDGVVKVTLVLLIGDASARKWVCEEILAEKKSDGVLLAPNDMNIPQKFVELKLRFQDLREYVQHLEQRVEKMEKRLEDIIEGYDLT